MTNEVLLFSGGLDSVAAWHLLNKPKALYVELGHRYQDRELASIERSGIPVKRTGRLFLGDCEQADAHIPFRNLAFALVAAMEADTIYTVALKGEGSRDKSKKFFRDTSKLLSHIAGRKIVYTAPFAHLTKTALVSKYVERGFDVQTLLNSTSCYAATFSDGYTGCGECMACFRRWVAMTLNGISENYVKNPAEWDGIKRVKAGWKALLHADPREWGHIAANNLEALKALRTNTKQHSKGDYV